MYKCATSSLTMNLHRYILHHRRYQFGALRSTLDFCAEVVTGRGANQQLIHHNDDTLLHGRVAGTFEFDVIAPPSDFRRWTT